ncbi:unnamed protein product [Trichogramma brassicae]|uniref:Uncharacterized protein n=1 Tax=Trichogramma brassicae TaxID=86971 RepID=A0A6H5I8X9_9HYME|nr:unnamed protein product [Trichogramma brassicae]
MRFREAQFTLPRFASRIVSVFKSAPEEQPWRSASHRNPSINNSRRCLSLLMTIAKYCIFVTGCSRACSARLRARPRRASPVSVPRPARAPRPRRPRRRHARGRPRQGRSLPRLQRGAVQGLAPRPDPAPRAGDPPPPRAAPSRGAGAAPRRRLSSRARAPRLSRTPGSPRSRRSRDRHRRGRPRQGRALPRLRRGAVESGASRPGVASRRRLRPPSLLINYIFEAGAAWREKKAPRVALRARAHGLQRAPLSLLRAATSGGGSYTRSGRRTRTRDRARCNIEDCECVSILLSVIATVLGSPQYYHGAPHAYAPHGGAAPLGPDGRVVDTPEVAHAKSAHLAALAEAAARAPKGPVGHYDAPVHAHGLAYAPHAAYAHGPRYRSSMPRPSTSRCTMLRCRKPDLLDQSMAQLLDTTELQSITTALTTLPTTTTEQSTNHHHRYIY